MHVDASLPQRTHHVALDRHPLCKFIPDFGAVKHGLALRLRTILSCMASLSLFTGWNPPMTRRTPFLHSPSTNHPSASPVTLSPWVNEQRPPLNQLLSAHDVARLTRRHRLVVASLALCG